MGDQLYYFGYANVDDNPTGFFEFDEHTPEALAQHNQFRTDSQAALDRVCSPDYQNEASFEHNGGETIPLFDDEDL